MIAVLADLSMRTKAWIILWFVISLIVIFIVWFKWLMYVVMRWLEKRVEPHKITTPNEEQDYNEPIAKKKKRYKNDHPGNRGD